MSDRSPSDSRAPSGAPTRDFDLGDVLTVSDGRLLSPRGMEGVYDILNFMTGDNLFTHQLPRALRVCKPAMLAQHPDLASLDTETRIDAENIRAWMDAQKRIFGERRTVATLAPQTWTNIDAVTEAELLFGKDRVATVEAPHV